MITGKQYANEVLRLANVKPQPGYIWGTSGQIWRQVDQTALTNKYNSNPKKYADLKLGVEYGSKWLGHIVYDCSGLTSKAAKNLGLSYCHGSNSSWKKDCEYKGELKKGMSLPEGAWVYTGTSENDHPHIGTYTGDGWVTEAQGTKTGVTKTKLTNNKWKWWGLGKGMSFDFIPGQTVNPVVAPNPTPTQPITPVKESKKRPTIRRGDRGGAVRELQSLLAKNGSSLAIDGIFGPGTQSAVRAFQFRNGLVVDGIVGPKTWAALLKT